MNPSALEQVTERFPEPPARLVESRTCSPPAPADLRIAHLLRKCNPDEWGGTETAIQRLCEGLQQHAVTSVVYCPRLAKDPGSDPLTRAGYTVKRFNACVPIWGLSSERRRQLISVGGNLMSFHLMGALWHEPDLSVIHAHTMGRLGGIALTVARQRRLPFVVTIHGGALDVPPELKSSFENSSWEGLDWGKAFGLLLRSHRLFTYADAIITCNPNEAALLRKQHPSRRIVVQPHGVRVEQYRDDQRSAALEAYPELAGRDVLFCLGRIDSVKNQRWLVEQTPALLQRYPNLHLAFVGACTDEAYGTALHERVAGLGLKDRMLFTGGLPPNDPRLVGLLQLARAVVLPSISETFGLVLLEAWAAGTPVIASRTSGATCLIQHQKNGWLFDLKQPDTFHEAVDQLFSNLHRAKETAAEGHRLVCREYDNTVLAGRVRDMYEQLIEEKHAIRHSSRR